MLTFIQAIILGLVQGASELFPVSSLGHSVILPSLLGWHVVQSDPAFVIFLVATHLATSLVLFAFFWADWKQIIKAFFRSVKNFKISHSDMYERLAWLLILGTIPAGILGLLLQKYLQNLFASPGGAACFLILNGMMLFFAEAYSKRPSQKELKQKMEQKAQTNKAIDTDVTQLSWMQSLKVGCMQALALIPGLSRTGSTVTGGLFVGLDREAAVRFAFLLATPIIFAASVLKLPELVHVPQALMPTLVGACAAAIAAYISIVYLTNYFKRKVHTLNPFGWYCVVFGLVSLVVLYAR